jgi:hypothetical protein
MKENLFYLTTVCYIYLRWFLITKPLSLVLVLDTTILSLSILVSSGLKSVTTNALSISVLHGSNNATTTPIKLIVILVQEDISFDLLSHSLQAALIFLAVQPFFLCMVCRSLCETLLEFIIYYLLFRSCEVCHCHDGVCCPHCSMALRMSPTNKRDKERLRQIQLRRG